MFKLLFCRYLVLILGQKVCHVINKNSKSLIPNFNKNITQIHIQIEIWLSLNLASNLNLFCHKFDI